MQWKNLCHSKNFHPFGIFFEEGQKLKLWASKYQLLFICTICFFKSLKIKSIQRLTKERKKEKKRKQFHPLSKTKNQSLIKSTPPPPKHSRTPLRHSHTPPHLRQSHRSNTEHNRIRKLLCRRTTRSRVTCIFLRFFPQDTKKVTSTREELFFSVTTIMSKGRGLGGKEVRKEEREEGRGKGK